MKKSAQNIRRKNQHHWDRPSLASRSEHSSGKTTYSTNLGGIWCGICISGSLRNNLGVLFLCIGLEVGWIAGYGWRRTVRIWSRRAETDPSSPCWFLPVRTLGDSLNFSSFFFLFLIYWKFQQTLNHMEIVIYSIMIEFLYLSGFVRL